MERRESSPHEFVPDITEQVQAALSQSTCFKFIQEIRVSRQKMSSSELLGSANSLVIAAEDGVRLVHDSLAAVGTGEYAQLLPPELHKRFFLEFNPTTYFDALRGARTQLETQAQDCEEHMDTPAGPYAAAAAHAMLRGFDAGLQVIGVGRMLNPSDTDLTNDNGINAAELVAAARALLPAEG